MLDPSDFLWSSRVVHANSPTASLAWFPHRIVKRINLYVYIKNYRYRAVTRLNRAALERDGSVFSPRYQRRFYTAAAMDRLDAADRTATRELR